MYLSRAELDPTRRSTMIALTSPQKFHGAVENSFSGENCICCCSARSSPT